MSNPFAVFLVARTKGGYAATTRAADRGESGRIGLPGGKVDDGESAVVALRRESAEEGWFLSSDAVLRLIHEQDVEGRPVAWYELVRGRVKALRSYKEKGRITPIVVGLAELIKSGYGNDVALKGLV